VPRYHGWHERPFH